MTPRLFATRSRTVDADLAFRARGAEVSRLEGFSDTVFGFAITLLVLSTKIPDTFGELLAMRHAVLPFVASFAVLFVIWRAQFDFFRRFGLEDRTTVHLTAAMLLIVLLAIYPVRFLFTFLLDVLPVALLAGNDSMKATLQLDDLPKVILLYGLGYFGIASVFARLYRHAASCGDVLGLSDLELFDTRAIARRWHAVTLVALTLIAWCVALLLLGEHARTRDTIWRAGYHLGSVVVVAVAVVQRLALRRLARERAALVA